jgi:AcrR family transcriptional regulator
MEKTPKKRTYAGIDGEQREIARRKRLIEAGFNLFGEIGYRETTVRKVCHEAGLTQRYFYESFENMEQLLIEVYNYCTDQIQNKIQEAIMIGVLQKNINEPSLIHDIVSTFFSAIEDPRVLRICWIEILSTSSFFSNVYMNKMKMFYDLVLKALEIHYPNWAMTKEQKTIWVMGMVNMISQSGLHWFLNQYSPPKEQMVNTLSDMVLSMMYKINLVIYKSIKDL